MSNKAVEKLDIEGSIRIQFMNHLIPAVESLLREGYVVQVTPVFDTFPRENNLKYYDVNYLKVVSK